MGMLRFFLALSVISVHAGTSVFGLHGFVGQYAVDFFFVISGFFMAMVLNTRYKESDPIHFYLNRALRLLPTYYIGLLLAFVISYSDIVQFFGQLDGGAKLFYLIQNLFLLGQDASYLVCSHQAAGGCADPIGMTMNPPTWSLSVECIFFIAAPFIVKSPKRTYLMLLIGAIYAAALHRIAFPIESVDGLRNSGAYSLNMYFYPASFIFFGGGALGYHLSQRKSAPPYWPLAFLALILSFSYTVMPAWHMMLIALMVPVLFNYTRNNRLDRLLGDVTYPAYIYHFPILVLLTPLARSHPQYFNLVSLGSMVALLAAGSGYLSHTVIENRINAYRRSLALKTDERQVLGNRHPTPWPRYAPVVVALYLLVPAPTLFYIFQAQTAQRNVSWFDALRHSPRAPAPPAAAMPLTPPAKEAANN